jgi:superfamily II DNA/RNA helicase
MGFQKFNFKEEIMNEIKKVGYTIPTPIQENAIPHIMEGKDVLGLAKTGTGKTATFVLPLLEKLKRGDKNVKALIIAPTRELAEQINSTITQLGNGTSLKNCVIYGGVSSKIQIDNLKKGMDIVVGCPGRLLDLLNQGFLKLNKLEVLVLDEADHMFDMGFLNDIRKIIKQTPVKKQNLLFSATMPVEIKKLVSEILKEPVIIEVEHNEAIKKIEQFLIKVENISKKSQLLDTLEKLSFDSLIIFTKNKHKAKNLSRILESKNYNSVSFQGDLPQSRREKALDGFRKGEYKVLVATDIAARGLDIPQVTHIINYDMPDTVAAFTHRSGRTGRAGKSGVVISFATKEESKIIQEIEKLNKTVFTKTTSRYRLEEKEGYQAVKTIEKKENNFKNKEGNRERNKEGNKEGNKNSQKKYKK